MRRRRAGEVILDDVKSRLTIKIMAAEVADVVARMLDAGRIALAADALGAAERGLADAVAYAGYP